ADLIAELAAATPRIPVILATSGDPAAEEEGLRAGADGVLAKPVDSLAAFRHAILSRLDRGEDAAPPPPAVSRAEDRVHPDALALRDDLARAAEVLEETGGLAYLSRFLASLARSSGDAALKDAA